MRSRRQRFIRVALIPLAAVVTLLVLLRGLLFYSLFGVETVVLRREYSNSYKMYAVMFFKDGGATTKRVFHVGMSKSGQKTPSSDQTVFIADSVYDPDRVEINWVNDNLVIGVPKSAQIHRKLNVYTSDWKSIKIVYENLE